MAGPGVVIAPEHKVVLDTDPDRARAIGRACVSDPYLKLSNYASNLRRYGTPTPTSRAAAAIA